MLFFTFTKAPVTLDPLTSSDQLLLFNKSTAVQYTDYAHWVPDNPERFHSGVLSCRGYTSGLHCWDVEVGDCNKYMIGVVAENVNRKTLLRQDPQNLFCVLQLSDGVYRAGGRRQTAIEVCGVPWIIRVWLDCDKGLVKFCDPHKNYILYIFKYKFNVKVFPYFCSRDDLCPMHLFPGNRSN